MVQKNANESQLFDQKKSANFVIKIGLKRDNSLSVFRNKSGTQKEKKITKIIQKIRLINNSRG